MPRGMNHQAMRCDAVPVVVHIALGQDPVADLHQSVWFLTVGFGQAGSDQAEQRRNDVVSAEITPCTKLAPAKLGVIEPGQYRVERLHVVGDGVEDNQVDRVSRHGDANLSAAA